MEFLQAISNDGPIEKAELEKEGGWRQGLALRILKQTKEEHNLFKISCGVYYWKANATFRNRKPR